MNTIATIFSLFGIVALIVAGILKVGRISVKQKIVELEELKEQLIDSKDTHEDLVCEIDEKLEELEEYLICGKKSD